MRAARHWFLLVALAAAVAALASWSLLEARKQRREVEAALAMQASLVARSLGPGLAAASSAARELEEVVTWRLLDNAHLLGALHEAGALTETRLARAVEQADLDTVAVVDRNGRIVRIAGTEIDERVVSEAGEILRGAADELIVGSRSEGGVEHIGVAVSTADGGAAIVRVHASSAQSLARRIGVGNLLRSLVGSPGVLYLAYVEDPRGARLDAAWDGGPVPAPGDEEGELREIRGRTAFEARVPVDAPAGVTATLRVGLDGEPLNRAAASATRHSLLAGLLLAAFGASLAGFAIVSRARAVEREQAARRLAEAEVARRRGERLAAAGALTAGLAHEVRSPLNAIGLAAQRIERRHADGEECREFAGRIREEVRRLEGVLKQFLVFARPVSAARESTDLRSLADEVVGLLAEEAAQKDVRLAAVTGAGDARVDREALRRSLINLVRNAVQASPRGGTVDTRVEQTADEASVIVADEGPGVDPEMAEKVFEPFFTTRAAGSGLGLSLVRRVAREHGGDCRIRRLPGGGAEAALTVLRSGAEGKA